MTEYQIVWNGAATGPMLTGMWPLVDKHLLEELNLLERRRQSGNSPFGKIQPSRRNVTARIQRDPATGRFLPGVSCL